jgi:hypothetical protein
MKIESIEVIPMSKESKWEGVVKQFDVFNITTNYADWRQWLINTEKTTGVEFSMDKSCFAFARAQKAFMTSVLAIFGTTTYEAKSRVTDTLDGVTLDGLLYTVETYETADETAEKTVMRKYLDPDTFETKEGLWYPNKKIYKIRYGIPVSASS